MVAWYVERADRLLDDLRERVQSQRSRGGQLAGFAGGVIALVGANAESMLDALRGAARVQVRTTNALLASIATTTKQGDRAAEAVRRAARLFLAGLLSVAGALAILVAVVTF